MPLIEDKDQQVAFARAIGQPDFDPVEQDFKTLLSAALRTENTIGSFIARNNGLPNDIVNNESFNPWNHITDDEKQDPVFTDHINLADSVEEINAVRAQSTREQKDRQILSEGGAMSFFTQFIAGAVDPINLVPVGGVAYRTFKTGGSILKNAAVTAGVASGTQAAVEMGLHHSQLQRTYGESALNVTGAMLIGGILGGSTTAIKNAFDNTPDLNAKIDDSMNPEPKVAAGDNSIYEGNHKSAGAAAVDRDIQVQGAISKAMVKALGFDPLSRSLTSDLQETRFMATELAENPIAMENKTGTFVADSVESRAKIKDGLYYEALENHMTAFKEYRAGGGTLKKGDFNELVSKEMRNPSSKDKQIISAAEGWRTKLYEPIKKEMIEQKLLPEDVDVTTAESYLNRVWNKQKIRANLNNFVNVTATWLKEQDIAKMNKAPDVLKVSDAVDAQAAKIKSTTSKIQTAESQLAKAEKQLSEALKTKKQVVERSFDVKNDPKRREIGVFGTKTVNRTKVLNDRVSGLKAKLDTLKGEESALIKGSDDSLVELSEVLANFPSKASKRFKKSLENLGDKPLSSLKKEMNAIVKGIKNQDLEDIGIDEYESLAREISTRITSTPDGRLPYNYQIGENSAKSAPSKQGAPGATKARSFTIPDSLVEQFLENDVEVLGGRYLNGLAVDIELSKRFGKEALTDNAVFTKDIAESWDIRIQEASKTDPKKALKMAKEKDRDIESIAAMRDRMRGVYGEVDPDNFWVRAGRSARDLNYLRFMGGVVASSIPDMARIVMSNGIVSTFKNGLAPLISNTKAFKLSASEAKKYGIGTDVLMGGRSEIIADVADYSQGGTAFERGLRSASAKFGKVNLMDRWTAGIKQLHAVVAQTDMANMFTAGKFDKRVQQLGISRANAENIGEQLKKYGQKTDGVWIAKTRDWDNQELAEIWGAALRKESDRVIVVPGQEKPLFMSSELGKTIFQFRSFMFSATQRMLIAGIQGQDAHFMQGAIGLTSLGMMAYAFKQTDAGRPLSDDPAVWVTEGIDRSGLTGIIMEMNNTIEKVSANNYGLRPLLGISTPSSRFASRSQSEAFLGPTFGSLLSTVLTVSGGAADGELGNSDVRAIRRLIPYQNLMIFRNLIDKVEEQVE